MSLKFRGLFAPMASMAALLGAFVPTAWAQPRFAPPERASAEAVGQAIGGPTLITLQAKDISPAKVFQDLAKQAGLGLDDYAVQEQFAEAKPISVDFVKQPFWVVVRSLSARLDLDFFINPSPNWNVERCWTLALRPGRDPRFHGPAQVSGPFLIIASSVARSLDLSEPDAPPNEQRAVVEFLLLIDPKLSVRGSPQGRDATVQGEAGPLKARESYYAWTHEVESKWPLLWRTKLIVELPDQNVRKLASVKGTLRGLLVATKSEVWKVEDILKAKDLAKDAGSGRFFLRQLAKDTSGRDTVFTLTLGSGGAGEEADAGWPSRSNHDRLSSLRLLSAKGRRFYPETSSYESGQFVVKYRVAHNSDPAADPAVLQWQLPTQIVEVEIPLEFKDLPVP